MPAQVPAWLPVYCPHTAGRGAGFVLKRLASHGPGTVPGRDRRPNAVGRGSGGRCGRARQGSGRAGGGCAEADGPAEGAQLLPHWPYCWPPSSRVRRAVWARVREQRERGRGVEGRRQRGGGAAAPPGDKAGDATGDGRRGCAGSPRAARPRPPGGYACCECGPRDPPGSGAGLRARDAGCARSRVSVIAQTRCAGADLCEPLPREADAVSRPVRRVRCKALQTSSVSSSTRRKPPSLLAKKGPLQVIAVRCVCPCVYKSARSCAVCRLRTRLCCLRGGCRCMTR